MLADWGKVRRGKFLSLSKILLILSYKFQLFEKFNFRDLSKISSLFPDKIFLNKVF